MVVVAIAVVGEMQWKAATQQQQSSGLGPWGPGDSGSISVAGGAAVVLNRVQQSPDGVQRLRWDGRGIAAGS